MKKRLFQAGVVLASLLSILSTTITDRSETEIETNYICEMPYAGVISSNIPVISDLEEKEGNQVTEIALEAPKTPELATLTYQTYCDMGLTEERFYDDLEALALVTVAEAENQSEMGKRLVIDTVLNRMDNEQFDDTIMDVISAPSQFTSYENGRFDRVEISEEVCNLVVEELENRTNSDVLYFNTGDYAYDNHIIREGDHYFCGE